MGKGSTPRPVDPDKYAEGYKLAFGICRSTKCPQTLNCVRWLKTRDMIANNEYQFDADGVPCKYFVKFTGKKSPDDIKLS
jgi:hypothetical protein